MSPGAQSVGLEDRELNPGVQRWESPKGRRALAAESREPGAEGMHFSPCSAPGLLRDLGQIPCFLWASVSPFVTQGGSVLWI